MGTESPSEASERERGNWVSLTVDSWQAFESQILDPHAKVTKTLMRAYAYRGQANHDDWTLEPSFTRLARALGFSRTKATQVEELALQRFKSRAYTFLSPSAVVDNANVLHWWTLMQHYRAPTRILDWTASPIVGLYFAVNERFEDDGALWSVHRHSLNESGVSLYGEVPRFPLKGSTEDELWRAEDPPPRVFVLDRDRLTERMAAQQGSFTVSRDILVDHATAMEKQLPSHEPTDDGESLILRQKVRISAQAKPELLKRLHLMNVNAATLFPGLDGLGAEIEEAIRLYESDHSMQPGEP